MGNSPWNLSPPLHEPMNFFDFGAAIFLGVYQEKNCHSGVKKVFYPNNPHILCDSKYLFFLVNDKNSTKIVNTEVMKTRPSQQNKTNIFPRNNSERS
jgi:restriction endonuclease S subunit